MKELNPIIFQLIVQLSSSSEVLIEELRQKLLGHFQELKRALILHICLNENVPLYSGRTNYL